MKLKPISEKKWKVILRQFKNILLKYLSYIYFPGYRLKICAGCGKKKIVRKRFMDHFVICLKCIKKNYRPYWDYEKGWWKKK